MLTKIAHIGIAVKNVKEKAKLYEELFGVSLEREEVLKERGVSIGFLPVGESDLELIEPTGPESNIARFIEKRGEGLHHIAFQVENVTAAVEKLKSMGVKMIDQVPRPGASAELVAFIHPSATGGILIELVESTHK